MKVLFIGFGSIALKHYHAIIKLRPDAVFYALKSGDQSSGIENVIDIYSWDEVPFDLKFAIISNPTFRY